MDNEEELKKRLLQQKMQEQTQGQAMQNQAEAEQTQQAEEMLKKILPQILDEKARERLTNIKVVKPDAAMQLSMYLLQLFQTGQIKEKLTEEQMISILQKLNEKKEFNITRK